MEKVDKNINIEINNNMHMIYTYTQYPDKNRLIINKYVRNDKNMCDFFIKLHEKLKDDTITQNTIIDTTNSNSDFLYQIMMLVNQYYKNDVDRDTLIDARLGKEFTVADILFYLTPKCKPSGGKNKRKTKRKKSKRKTKRKKY